MPSLRPAGRVIPSWQVGLLGHVADPLQAVLVLLRRLEVTDVGIEASVDREVVGGLVE